MLKTIKELLCIHNFKFVEEKHNGFGSVNFTIVTVKCDKCSKEIEKVLK